MRLGDGANALRIEILHSLQILTDGFARDSERVEVKRSLFLRQLLQQRGNTARGPDILDMPLAVAIPRRRHFRQVRDAFGDFIESCERILDAGFMGNGDDVQKSVGRAAHRHIQGDGVVDRACIDDVAKANAAIEQLQQLARRRAGELVPLGRDGENRPVAGERDAERLAEAVHRIGGEHPATASARWAAGDLELLETCVVDRARRASANGLEHRDQIHFLAAAVDAGRHRPAGNENGGDVDACRAHQHARHDLVAVRNADHRVEAVRLHHRLHRVGDELARRQRVAHSLVPHRDAVVHSDGVELEWNSAGGAHGFLHHLSEFLEVRVAGNDVDVGIAHRYERLVEITALADLTGGPQQTPVRRALESLLDGVGTHYGFLGGCMRGMKRRRASSRDWGEALRYHRAPLPLREEAFVCVT